ncbi:Aste57867_432 [Aphanomyces stellatus]|uniref:Aste57867_432 protein n=1 Tax=Aphanomyces stellatus TaxID=120398 RepID=A0A485K3S6_9STRA|nr:hypothetical protein As57867_000431 [Aphanomyces stellatus]VFT77657.1 Aste57867_432 [Aphanomyces stellatus]
MFTSIGSLATTFPIVSGVLVCVLAIGGLFLYLFTIKPALSPLNAIPGPPSAHWIFGSLKEIIDTKWSKGHFPEPALSWIKKYGGVVHYRALLNHRVLLSDPEALKHVYNTNGENYPRSDDTRAFLRDITGGDGLLSSEGQTHTHMRKMLMPHFGFAKVKEFVGIFAAHTQRLDTQLLPLIDTPTVIDMHTFFTKLTLDIIGVSAFGYKFGSLENQNARVIAAFQMLNQPPSILYAVGSLYVPGFKNLPIKLVTQRREAKRMLFETVDQVIAAKLKAPRKATDTKLDLVDLMLDESTHTEHVISAEEARTHVMTFLIAGHETTSSALCWVFAMFAKHPEMEAKARAECRAVAADSEDKTTIGWKSLAELKYTTAFIHEALRMFPSVAQHAGRVCAKDDYLPVSEGKPVFLPKGTTIQVNTGALHRNPKYWSEPDTFLPERFLETTDAAAADKALRRGQGNTYYYMPFSAGAKNCIGMRFALAELQVVVANLLPKFSFRLAETANLNPKAEGVSIKPVALDMTVHAAP